MAAARQLAGSCAKTSCATHAVAPARATASALMGSKSLIGPSTWDEALANNSKSASTTAWMRWRTSRSLASLGAGSLGRAQPPQEFQRLPRTGERTRIIGPVDLLSGRLELANDLRSLRHWARRLPAATGQECQRHAPTVRVPAPSCSETPGSCLVPFGLGGCRSTSAFLVPSARRHREEGWSYRSGPRSPFLDVALRALQ